MFLLTKTYQVDLLLSNLQHKKWPNRIQTATKIVQTAVWGSCFPTHFMGADWGFYLEGQQLCPPRSLSESLFVWVTNKGRRSAVEEDGTKLNPYHCQIMSFILEKIRCLLNISYQSIIHQWDVTDRGSLVRTVDLESHRISPLDDFGRRVGSIILHFYTYIL